MSQENRKFKAGNTRSSTGRPSYLRRIVPDEKPETEIEEESPVDKKEEVKEDVELYSWENWLLPKRPLVAVVVVASLLASMGMAYWAVPQFFFVAIITIIFTNRLAPYLFPVKFILTEETVGYKTFMARDIRRWDRFLAYREFDDGVFLTHDTRTLRGRLREGLFLYYKEDGSNKDEILKIVESKLKPLHEAYSVEDAKKEDRGGLRSAFERIRKFRSRKKS